MQWVMTLVAVVAGLILSLAVAVLTEELIFGRVLALLFRSAARPATAAKNGPQQ